MNPLSAIQVNIYFAESKQSFIPDEFRWPDEFGFN